MQLPISQLPCQAVKTNSARRQIHAAICSLLLLPLLLLSVSVIDGLRARSAFVAPARSSTLRASNRKFKTTFLSKERSSLDSDATDSSVFPGITGSTALPLLVGCATALYIGMQQDTRSRANGRKPLALFAKKKGVRVVDGREIPWNIVNAKNPHRAKVIENRTLTEPTGDSNWQTCHVTIEHDGAVPYLEGQSIGVVAPGPDKKGETPAKVRTYSIASSSVGDDGRSNTVSLCVKRLVEVSGKHSNVEMGADSPDAGGSHHPDNKVYRGVASNHLCDAQPGDEVLISGPTGAEMLLPDDPEANIIMIATGTGIAPMRSYLRLLFHDEVGGNADGSRKFKGKAWLFLGVPYTKSLLYTDEHADYASRFPEQFRSDYAISREQESAAGDKMYIQTKMTEYADELWALMKQPKTHVYVCGLKGMTSGIEECFGPLAEAEGAKWKDVSKSMKKEGRYHVEVY